MASSEQNLTCKGFYSNAKQLEDLHLSLWWVDIDLARVSRPVGQEVLEQ
jgi:hypothetical protein